MGDPKKQRKKYDTPRFPWRTDTLQMELKLLGQYGLRNKRELWRHKTMLSKFRGIARSLLGMPLSQRRTLEAQLLSRLQRLGILSKKAVLDEVLDLTLEDILELHYGIRLGSIFCPAAGDELRRLHHVRRGIPGTRNGPAPGMDRSPSRGRSGFDRNGRMVEKPRRSPARRPDW